MRSGVGRDSAPPTALLSGAPLISISLRPVRPVSIDRSAFRSDSWKVRPIDIASPTLFIEVGRRASGPRELRKGEAGNFGDDIVDLRQERGGRRAGDVVHQLVEGVAAGQTRRD